MRWEVQVIRVWHHSLFSSFHLLLTRNWDDDKIDNNKFLRSGRRKKGWPKGQSYWQWDRLHQCKPPTMRIKKKANTEKEVRKDQRFKRPRFIPNFLPQVRQVQLGLSIRARQFPVERSGQQISSASFALGFRKSPLRSRVGGSGGWSRHRPANLEIGEGNYNDEMSRGQRFVWGLFGVGFRAE